jgi:hypothetical protein
MRTWARTRLLLTLTIGLIFGACDNASVDTATSVTTASPTTGRETSSPPTSTALEPTPLLGSDPTSLIVDVEWADWGEATRFERVEYPDDLVGAVAMLPASEPQMLYVGLWGTTCLPFVTVSAEPSPEEVTFHLAVSEYVPGPGEGECGDIFQGSALRLTLAEPVELDSVVLTIEDTRTG